MSYYIYGIFPPDIDKYDLMWVLNPARFWFIDAYNPSLVGQIRPDCLGGLIHCEDGPGIGVYTKWSRTCDEDPELPPREWIDFIPARGPRLANWRGLIQSLVTDYPNMTFYLLCHWFPGHINNEEFDTLEHRLWTIDQVDDVMLATLEHDVLHTFGAHPPREC